MGPTCCASPPSHWTLYKEFDAQVKIPYDLISQENVDGLVIWGTRLAVTMTPDEVRAFCERYSFPIVNVGLSLEGTPSVFVDNYPGMYDLVTHLIQEHNCRRIAFAGGPEKNPELEDRYRAYTEALAKAGIPFDNNLVVFGDWSRESGVAAISELLEGRKADFDAVVAANDEVALGAIGALQKRGKLVPTDIPVVGFDDIKESRYSIPPLTTVKLSFYEYGKRAAEMLLRLLMGKNVPEQVALPTELVVRQSCGCSDPAIVHAKAGIVKTASTIPKMALAASLENLNFEMVKVLRNSSIYNVGEWCNQLLNAFKAEFTGTTSRTFLSTLDETLRQEMLAGGDMFAWQDVISVMRCNILPYVIDDQKQYHLEDLWQQARVLIGERAQQAQGYLRLQAEQRTATLNAINQALVTSSDTEELMDILVEGLPRLNIPSCYVSLYEESSGSNGDLPKYSDIQSRSTHCVRQR